MPLNIIRISYNGQVWLLQPPQKIIITFFKSWMVSHYPESKPLTTVGQILNNQSLQTHLLSVSPREAMFQPQPSTFWSLNIHSFCNYLGSVVYVLSSVLGAGIIIVNRYPCSHGTYILVNISVPCVKCILFSLPNCLSSHLWQHPAHFSCLSLDATSPMRPSGLPSIRGSDFFLHLSMCPTCIFMTASPTWSS